MIRKALLVTLLAPLALFAEVNLSALFSDGMVLQQEKAVPVWGWADAGTSVTVFFAGQKKTTKVPASGKWMVKLDPLKASAEGQEMKVMVGGEIKMINCLMNITAI